MLGELLQPGCPHRAGGRRGSAELGLAPVRLSVTASSVARTDRPSATMRAASVLLGARLLQAEQRAGMPGGEDAGGHPPLHRDGQVEQPDGVA